VSEPDDITIRRIWKLENDLADLRRLVTSPTTVLTALESDRKVNDGRFDRIEATQGEHTRQLAAIEEQLAAILAAVKGGGG
jgi:septal ring factor EnvC (AmiA/AmiB activator)